MNNSDDVVYRCVYAIKRFLNSNSVDYLKLILAVAMTTWPRSLFLTQVSSYHSSAAVCSWWSQPTCEPCARSRFMPRKAITDPGNSAAGNGRGQGTRDQGQGTGSNGIGEAALDLGFPWIHVTKVRFLDVHMAGACLACNTTIVSSILDESVKL